jgi:pyruvate kinase
MKKRTKIVCTVGPASAKPTTLTSMMRAGMDVARLNFSHATHKDHKALMRAIRKAAKQAKKYVPIIGDLQGPKIRLGLLPEEGVQLKTGEVVKFTTATAAYKDGRIPVTYKKLHEDVKKGHRMLIEDGIYELVVQRVTGKTISAKVVNGGTVTSHKGMNFPDSTLNVNAFTKKDKEDASFGVAQGVEWLALSFVTSPKEVMQLKRLIQRETPKGQLPARVMVKIEKHEALKNFAEILDVADGIMIARGDLGVEIPAEDVPVAQKQIIEHCRHIGKPVIVATQMLDSMIRNPRPTRAEVSDVANAVFDHTDAVMLSGESATGKYPLKAVRMMAKIVVEAEGSEYDNIPLSLDRMNDRVADASQALKVLALEDQIDAVVAAHGLVPWSEMLHKTHPEIPLFLASESERDARQVSIHWGVKAWVMKNQKEATFVNRALRHLRKNRWMKKGTRVACISGSMDKQDISIVVV